MKLAQKMQPGLERVSNNAFKAGFMAREIQRLNGDAGKGRLIRIHPAWYSFIKFCENLKYGEIEKLKIQDGLPLIAEEVKKKIKFFVEE